MLAEQVHEATGASVELAYVDQGYSGAAAEAAEKQGIRLEVVKHPAAKGGFMLLPGAGSWSAVSTGQCASAVSLTYYKRLASTLGGLHLLAFLILMLSTLAKTTA